MLLALSVSSCCTGTGNGRGRIPVIMILWKMHNNISDPRMGVQIISKEEITMIDKYVIVRGDRSGVFAGRLVREEGQKVVLKDCRRL